MNDQEFNVRFVGEVEKREVLYNYTLPEYSRKDVTDKAWQEVSTALSIPVPYCKEKWKNLRTVFMRRLKPPPSGSGGRRKPYYLENVMQFCLPFIKTVAPASSRSLSVPPSKTHPSAGHTEDSECNDSELEDSVQLEDEAAYVQQNYSPSVSPSVLNEPQTEPHPQSSSSKRTFQITKKQNEMSTSVADLSVAEYFQAKRAKLQSNDEIEGWIGHRIDRQQGIKMFLLNLIPELEELSDSQIKIFKRQVFRVIDDITASERKPL